MDALGKAFGKMAWVVRGLRWVGRNIQMSGVCEEKDPRVS